MRHEYTSTTSFAFSGVLLLNAQGPTKQPVKNDKSRLIGSRIYALKKQSKFVLKWIYIFLFVLYLITIYIFRKCILQSDDISVREPGCQLTAVPIRPFIHYNFVN